MSAQRVKYQAKGFSLKLVAWLISIFAIVISALLVFSVVYISQKNEEVNISTQNYITLKNAANDVQLASDDLTNDVRLFVTTTKKEYMDSYFKEANVTQRRDKALVAIHELTENTPVHEIVHDSIEAAVNESKNLMNLEFKAMKLICVDEGIDCSEYPEVADYVIDPSISVVDYFDLAMESVFGDEYMQSIAEAVRLWSEEADLSHHLRILGYRNVWSTFHPAESNVYVPVSLNDLAVFEKAFKDSYLTQVKAEFPNPDFDGPFSELAEMIWLKQLKDVQLMLGKNFFYENNHPLIRATHGLLFLKEMSAKEFVALAEEMRLN